MGGDPSLALSKSGGFLDPSLDLSKSGGFRGVNSASLSRPEAVEEEVSGKKSLVESSSDSDTATTVRLRRVNRSSDIRTTSPSLIINKKGKTEKNNGALLYYGMKRQLNFSTHICGQLPRFNAGVYKYNIWPSS